MTCRARAAKDGVCTPDLLSNHWKFELSACPLLCGIGRKDTTPYNLEQPVGFKLPVALSQTPERKPAQFQQPSSTVFINECVALTISGTLFRSPCAKRQSLHISTLRRSG
jgi:hypothetical protein